MKRDNFQEDFPDDINDAKNINISLATGVFVVILITIVELLGSIIRAYIPSFTLWLEKLLILVLLILFFKCINKRHTFIQEVEGYLAKVSKKK
ncbi:MAG: hypothetical protein V1859_11375 [archaeon]